MPATRRRREWGRGVRARSQGRKVSRESHLLLQIVTLLQHFLRFTGTGGRQSLHQGVYEVFSVVDVGFGSGRWGHL